MTKVFITIRQGRQVIKKGSVNFEQIINRLINLTNGAGEPIKCRHLLQEGCTYKYKERGFNITLTPIYNEDYS